MQVVDAQSITKLWVTRFRNTSVALNFEPRGNFISRFKMLQLHLLIILKMLSTDSIDDTNKRMLVDPHVDCTEDGALG